MRYAILYNVFCCWMVTIIGAGVGRHIELYRDQSALDRSYALFWIAAAALWFTTGLRQLFYFMGLVSADRFLFYIVQVWVAVHMIPATAFVMLNLTRRTRWVVAGVSVMTLLIVTSVVMTIAIGVTAAPSSAWTSEYEIPAAARAFFLPAFCLMTALTVGNTALGFFRWRRGAAPFEPVFGTLALLIYLSAGYVDVLGDSRTWHILAIRAIYLLSALIAFTAYTWRPDPDSVRDTLMRSDW